jgi:hypothetical protein
VAVFIILFVLSFVVAGVHIYRDEQPRTGGRVAEILLIWLLVINIGFGGLYAFSGHLFAADEVAASIGWPAGNPFQTEVAVANLAIGTLGILSYWIRGNFWIAAVIATSIWLLGAAAIHVSEMVGAGNYNPGNAGVVFYMDVIGPALLIILLVYLRYAGRTRAEFANEERPAGQLR